MKYLIHQKNNLIFGKETFVCNYRDQTFPVVLDQVCTHCSRDLAHSSIQISRSFRFRGCRWAIRTFSSLQRFSIGFRSGDWLGHSRTLRCFLWSHSLVALAVCLGSLSWWKTLPSSMLLLREGGCWPRSCDTWPHPSSPQDGAVVLSPLQKSIPKEWCFHLHSSRLWWCSWGCTHPSSSSKHGERNLDQKAIFISTDHMTFSHSASGSPWWSLANFRWAWTCAGLACAAAF